MTNTEKIPLELKTLPQWVNWKWEKTEKGKDTKPLYNSRTGRKASHSNSKTWSTYEQALAAHQNGNGFDGIGFVFSEQDPFTGVDLDHVLDPVTGKMATWAEKLIHEFKSYTEISPSGTGVKIIVKGKLPSGGIKTKHVEAYDRTRYFTTTGNIFAGYDRIIENQDAILSLVEKIRKDRERSQQKPRPESPRYEATPDDEQLIAKMLDSQNRFKIAPLLDGDHGGYPSQSEADQALCNHLAFWTGKDAAQMDRIFRGSGLYREKWDKKHFGDGRTYGEATIQRAIANTHETYKGSKQRQANSDEQPKSTKGPNRARGLRLDQLKSQYNSKVSWIWKRHIPAGLPMILNGREGMGKTTIGLKIGKEIIERHQTGMVVWLATEGAVQDTVAKMVEQDLTSDRFVVAQKANQSFKWDFILQGDRKELETLLDDLQPILCVFIDSIRGMSRLDDNDAKNGDIIQQINAVVCDKHRAGLVYIDHMGKGKKSNLLDKAVGTTAKTSSVRGVLSVMPVSRFKRKIVPAKANISTMGGELEVLKVGNEIIIHEPEIQSDESMTDRAEEFLIDLFSKTPCMAARDVYSKGEEEGISSHILKKAKRPLGIQAEKKGPKDPWMWSWTL